MRTHEISEICSRLRVEKRATMSVEGCSCKICVISRAIREEQGSNSSTKSDKQLKKLAKFSFKDPNWVKNALKDQLWEIEKLRSPAFSVSSVIRSCASKGGRQAPRSTDSQHRQHFIGPAHPEIEIRKPVSDPFVQPFSPPTAKNLPGTPRSKDNLEYRSPTVSLSENSVSAVQNRLVEQPPTPSVFINNRSVAYENSSFRVPNSKTVQRSGPPVQSASRDGARMVAGFDPPSDYSRELRTMSTVSGRQSKHIPQEPRNSNFRGHGLPSVENTERVLPQIPLAAQRNENSDGAWGPSVQNSSVGRVAMLNESYKPKQGQQSILSFTVPATNKDKADSLKTETRKPMLASPSLNSFPVQQKRQSKMKRNSFYKPIDLIDPRKTPTDSVQSTLPPDDFVPPSKSSRVVSREAVELSPGVCQIQPQPSASSSDRFRLSYSPMGNFEEERVFDDEDVIDEDALLVQMAIESERKMEEEKLMKMQANPPSTSRGRTDSELDDFLAAEDEAEYLNEEPEVVDLAAENWLEKEPSRQQIQFDPRANRYDAHGQFRSMLRDDSEKFSSTYPVRDTVIRNALKQTFGLNQFRHKQRSAIIAALDDHDCFILMPTGAGKSLCYQLPSVIPIRTVPDVSVKNGKREIFGVTVVVSPLLSLIEDQVDKMKGINVKAVALTGDLSAGDMDKIFADFDKYEPNAFAGSGNENGKEKYPTIRLLYVTPEKLEKSGKVLNALKFLHQRQLLSRIVIDEAHCVSQWGHDFRPDYTKLGSLREKISGVNGNTSYVPLVALTATATPKIVSDIKRQLKMRNPQMFISSFCRPNLKYIVLKKASRILTNVINRVKKSFPNQSGILYCLSRKECEEVASSLRKQGIEAEAYHAGLSDSKRKTIQRSWIRGKVKVICATVAFGMGIDKPDVRFVIHYSIPKSLEGYYQETGRAGRDGLPSDCILLYAYSDYIRMRRLIEDVEAKGQAMSMPMQVREMHMGNLKQILNYAENVAVCRRKILLEHFGEVYDEAACGADPETACDVCRNHASFRLFDVTEDAKLLTLMVCRMTDGCSRPENITLNHLAALYRGPSSTKKEVEKAESTGRNKDPVWGRGANLNQDEALRVIRQLVLEGILSERLFINQYGGTVCYMERGKCADELLCGNRRVHVHFEIGKAGGQQLQGRATVVSEAKAKADRMRGKYGDLSHRCYEDLVNLMMQISEEEKITSCFSIISVDGLQQIAGWMPRTQSDLLQVDTMTEHKLQIYGPQIMKVLKPYWDEADRKEQKDIEEQLWQLSNKQDRWEGIDRLSSRPVPQTPSGRGGRGRAFQPPIRGARNSADEGENGAGVVNANNGKKGKTGRKGWGGASRGRGRGARRGNGRSRGGGRSAVPTKNRDGTYTAKGTNKGLSKTFFPSD